MKTTIRKIMYLGRDVRIVCITTEFDANGSTTAAIVPQRRLACWRALVLEIVEASEVSTGPL
jgi:hypothetical protein